MSTNGVITIGEGQYQIQGSLDFSTVTELKKQASGLFNGASDIQFDLSGVTHSNSAALALLIEWLRQAGESNKHVRFINFPERLLNIARAYGIEEDLPIINE